MRLLIAEDEEDLAEVLSVFFEKNHFTVETVHNGFDAYEAAMQEQYDAIILDVMMPKMNGIEVLQKLRAEKVSTPIMMLTAKGETDDRITGFNAGADDYLPKPFDPDELLSRVRHAASRQRLPAYPAGLQRPDIGPRHRLSDQPRAVGTAERAGISGDGAVFAQPAHGVFS